MSPFRGIYTLMCRPAPVHDQCCGGHQGPEACSCNPKGKGPQRDCAHSVTQGSGAGAAPEACKQQEAQGPGRQRGRKHKPRPLPGISPDFGQHTPSARNALSNTPPLQAMHLAIFTQYSGQTLPLGAFITSPNSEGAQRTGNRQQSRQDTYSASCSSAHRRQLTSKPARSPIL